MKYYLWFVCFTPIFMIVLFLYGYLGNGAVPEWFQFLWRIVSINFWLGLLVLLPDLWRQKVKKEKKIMWTVLNLFMVFALPIYWYFRFFRFPKEQKMNEV